MIKYLSIVFVLLATIVCAAYKQHEHQPVVYSNEAPVQIYTFSPENTTSHTKKLSIRMAIFKHAKERMADNDADYAIRSCKKAENEGLDIKVIGNQFIDDLGHFDRLVSEHVKKQSSPGDTFIVHTIGHGLPSGLQALGPRSGVVKVLAQAASVNKQEILWWQLSCHAAGNLPPIDSLSPDQQKLFSNLASSSASQTSPTMEQGGIMEKVFVAIARKSRDIDPNGDGIITAGELKNFLNKIDNYKRGDLFFARNNDTPIFGLKRTNHLLPIIDKNNPQGKYNEDYIPIP